MNNLPVTCIIPCRNGSATIERAVKSAIDAGCDEIMVYDDSSTDDTFDVMLSLKKEYLSLDISSSGSIYTHGGVNFARNFMISRVSHGLIIPLDADDELRDVESLRAAYEPGVWVYGNYAEHDGDKITEIKGAAPGALPRKNITGVTFLFHKDDWQRAGGYDPDFAYAEDYAFQCSLVNVGVRAKYVDTVVYDRYLHPTGNERTALAGVYWTFYQQMARRKYQTLFAGTG